mmetsp:Transcript_11141/g.19634  ORF Transcript_11141/g.19634 Transcript_11141/m.19634 type:complete len:623 (-) Transcript_11141:213-2081(-)
MPPHSETGASSGPSPLGRPRQSQMLPPRAEKGPRQTRPPSHPGSILHHPNSIANKSNGKNSTSDLRKAYRAQNTSGSGGNLFDDHCSMSSASAANSGATPSSVYMPSVPLSRDVSDLSGVSGATRGSSVPGQIIDPKSFQQPWRQAYTLSARPPEQVLSGGGHLPSRHNNGTTKQQSNASAGPRACANASGGKRGASIWVPENDVVEIFDSLQTSLGLGRFEMAGHNRIPIMVLLMDPHRHCYELMQIWVDRGIDSIRDLVHSLQHKLPDKWKQAYDGIFQVRGKRFTQLINIIRLVKYDVQPHEILVAKPWAMTAKVTIAFAGTVIRHLRQIGVVNSQASVEGDNAFSRPKGEDVPLLLSRAAQERAYFPEGILNHHHAVQFVSFAPPFEAPGIDSATGVATPTDDTSSSESEYLGIEGAGNLAASLAMPKDSGNPPSPKSVLDLGLVESRRTNLSSSSAAKSSHPKKYSNHTEETRNGQNVRRQSKHPNYRESSSQLPPSAGVRGLLSKLNCCKSNDKEATISEGSVGPPAHRETTLTSLSEEEELRWLAYSMKPIAEDQSLTGNSVVSMSAPLLAPIAETTAYPPQSDGDFDFPEQKPRPTNPSRRESKEFGGRQVYEI